MQAYFGLDKIFP